MNLTPITQTLPHQEVTPTSRLLVVLHPNTRFISFMLSDRKFNNEQHSFNRKRPASGKEAALLAFCENHVIGVIEAKTSRSKLEIELELGTRPRDVVPQVVVAVKECFQMPGEPYLPEIFCMDERWKVAPIETEYSSHGGQKFAPGEAVIGLPYQPWNVD